MRNSNTRLMRAALAAMAFVLICAETASAQRFRRGRRSSATVQRYQWIVPVERYAPAVQSSSAITVRALLPAQDAELWVDGVRKVGGGDTRVAVFSPKNAEGKSQHIVQALWSQEDRVITDTRMVEIYPGDRITIDFTRPDPKGTSEEIVPKEAPPPK